MDDETENQLRTASIGSALLSDCLASSQSAILLTDEMRASFAALCAAFDFLEGRLRKQQEAGKLGGGYGRLGGKPTHKKGKKK